MQDALFDFEDASRATPPGSSPHTRCWHVPPAHCSPFTHAVALAFHIQRPLDETADKLDGMMDIVFAHLGR